MGEFDVDQYIYMVLKGLPTDCLLVETKNNTYYVETPGNNTSTDNQNEHHQRGTETYCVPPGVKS